MRRGTKTALPAWQENGQSRVVVYGTKKCRIVTLTVLLEVRSKAYNVATGVVLDLQNVEPVRY
jgi:hypothetical protein